MAKKSSSAEKLEAVLDIFQNDRTSLLAVVEEARQYNLMARGESKTKRFAQAIAALMAWNQTLESHSEQQDREIRALESTVHRLVSEFSALTKRVKLLERT